MSIGFLWTQTAVIFKKLHLKWQNCTHLKIMCSLRNVKNVTKLLQSVIKIYKSKISKFAVRRAFRLDLAGFLAVYRKTTRSVLFLYFYFL